MNTPGGLPLASFRRPLRNPNAAPPTRTARTLLLCVLAALAAAACGQSGPLYLPQSEARPEPRSQPATQPDDDGREDAGDESEEDRDEATRGA